MKIFTAAKAMLKRGGTLYMIDWAVTSGKKSRFVADAGGGKGGVEEWIALGIGRAGAKTALV